MKKLKSFLIASILLVSIAVFAQNKTEEIKIKTSAQCEMCKTRIENAITSEKGVVKSDLNIETQELTVTYKPDKTTPDKIRKTLKELGYDADGTLADPKAYSSLPECCQKPEDNRNTAK